VPRLLFAPQALADIERLSDFLLAQSARQARETGPLIHSALSALRMDPLIGR
jgi:plasmid stabilization system protein ParE